MKIYSIGANLFGTRFFGVAPAFSQQAYFNSNLQKDAVNFTGKRNLESVEDGDFEKYLERNKEGRIPVFYLNAWDTAKINAELKSRPDILSKMYLAEDIEGRVPAHYADAKKLSEINVALKDDPKTIENMYLAVDCIGAVPAEYYGAEELKVMNEALKDDIDVLGDIYALISHTASGIPTLDGAQNAKRQEFIIQTVKKLARSEGLGLEQYAKLLVSYEKYGIKLN